MHGWQNLGSPRGSDLLSDLNSEQINATSPIQVLTFAGVARQLGWVCLAHCRAQSMPVEATQVLTVGFIVGLAPVAIYTAVLMSRTDGVVPAVGRVVAQPPW